MKQHFSLDRRALLTLGAAAGAVFTAEAAAAQSAASTGLGDMRVIDPVKTELVMNLVVTCSTSEPMSPDAKKNIATDGLRNRIWPIIGGRFEGPNIRGEVIAGGGDFPYTRSDGVTVIDALYRLKTHDGYVIIIHNKGLSLGGGKYRLIPEFVVNQGPYDWLGKGVFVSTLTVGAAMPEAMRLAKGPNENDRLIQVHRIV